MSDASLARAARIPVAILRAIRQIESGGSACVVRFEPHVFNRITGGRHAHQIPFTRDPARGVSLVRAETNRAAFEHARRFDASAAVRSTSWGAYQVLGGKLLNLYDTPSKGVRAFDRDPIGVSDQVLVEWFRTKPRAAQAARDGDIAELARLYNGSTRWRDRLRDALARPTGRRPSAEGCPAVGGGGLGILFVVGVAGAAWFGGKWIRQRRMRFQPASRLERRRRAR